jgi:tellurite resistance protein
MATLSEDERGELRSKLARSTATQHWTKPQVNAALQSIEDLMVQTSTRNAVGGAIESAAAGVFDNSEKQLLFAIWSLTYARRQGIG